MTAPRSVPALYSAPGSTHGPFEFRGVLRLVDMPMEPEDRLGFEDRGTKSRAADRNQDLLSSPHNRAWRGRRRFQTRGAGRPRLLGGGLRPGECSSGDHHAAKKRTKKVAEAHPPYPPPRVSR